MLLDFKIFNVFSLLIKPIKVFLCFAFILASDFLTAQDTIPPQLIFPARDTSFECGATPNLLSNLTDWYNRAGGALATDNSDFVIWRANLTLLQVITIFNNSLDVLCGNKQKVEVSFTPIDTSSNRGPTTTASFFTTDNRGPRITNSVPNPKYTCVQGIRDTLIAWIKKSGGYNMVDDCSNSIIWKNFNYAISSANNIIQTGGGSIDIGPYPMIPDGICQWVMNISFIAADECGNESGTPGTTTFTVTDNVAPIFINPPADITVSCDNVPPVVEAIVIDDCSKSVKPELSESTTKVLDPLDCGHYNYVISRKWVATDKCGNSSTYSQKITVVDKTGPTISNLKEVNIGCAIFSKKPDSLFITYNDNCSSSMMTYKDSVLSNGCITKIERTYTLSDICKNQSTYKQIINVRQDAKPEITIQAKTESYACTSQEDIETLLANWVKNMGGSVAKATCSPLKSFAAVKGSYDINNTSTYPGQVPLNLPKQICPAVLNEFLRYVEVDFVYYDTCGNSAVTSAVFGIRDNVKPVINECPQSVEVLVSEDNCTANIKIIAPKATDNCIESESPVSRRIVVPVTSNDPAGPEAIVNPITMRLGPFNPSLASPLTDGILNLKLRNLDIDDVTEYFTIYDEDGKRIGQTPVGAGQCANADFQIVLDKNKISDWILDGYIELSFRPNIIVGSPVLSINNICNGGAIEATLSYEIEITNTVRRFYQINDGPEIQLGNETEINTILDKGSHSVRFKFRDCSNNTAECLVPVNVKDDVKPVIICPDNITTILAKGQCKDTVALPINFTVKENCGGTYQYSKLSPASTEASFLSFVYNENKLKYETRSKEIVFTEIFSVKHVNIPVVLEVEFTGDNNEAGEYFEIFGPGGVLIGNTSLTNVKESCATSITRFEISKDLFNSWITNKQVSIIAIPKNGGDGINPCTNLLPGQTIDNKSAISARLKYSDAAFSLSISGSTNIDEADIPKGVGLYNIILNAGINNLTLKTKDNSGNQAGCAFTVNVKDVEKPVARCKNIVVSLNPSGLEPIMILPEMINNGSTDNCQIGKMTVEPAMVDCSASDSNVSVMLIVEDSQGNKDTCISSVRVKAAELKPTFSAGLCSTDTLKLFANIPPASIPGTYSFQWDGPGNIAFFTENPQIPNADESYNGVYVLTVKGFNKCTSVGSLTVNIKPLIKPELRSNANELCVGEDALLTTTNYSGGIEYLWYEGIFPTGILIKTTKIPELVLKPTQGVHFYYIIASGPDCSSSPSALLKVDVKVIPVPEVCNSFLSLCDGSELILCARGNTSFVYNWAGPAGYKGVGQNPEIIKNVTILNAGEYRLVVSNGRCISDTTATRVTILEKPAKPLIVSADIFCEGAIFSMVATSSPNAEKFEWYKNGILFTTSQENSLIIANAQSGLQGSWTVVSVKGNCKSIISNTKFIAIDNSLEVGAINTGPVCMGDSVKLQATFVPNASYKWQGPVPFIPSVYDPVISGVPGDYSVTITTPTGCQNNASTRVSVISVPEITALSNDSKPCMSSTDQIRFSPSVFPNSDIYTFKWEGPNGYISTSKSPVLSNISAKDTGVYSLVIFNGSCPSNKQKTNVTFSLIPLKPSLSSSSFFCEKDTVRLIAINTMAADEYIWNTPLGKLNTSTPSLIIPEAGLVNMGKYTLETKTKGCISPSSDTLKVEIRKKPETQQLISNSPVCYGDTLKISGNSVSGAQYLWSGPTLVTNTSMINVPGVTKLNSGTYRLKITVNGCTSENSPPLNVIVKDEIKVPAFSGPPLSLCSDNLSGIQICLNPSSLEQGGLYSIYNETKKLTLASGNSNCYLITEPNSLTTGTNFLTAKTTKDNCQSEISASYVITVNSPPSIQAQAVEDDIRICPGENVTLISVKGPPLVTVKWTAVNPENIISDRNSISPIISGLKSGLNIIYLDYSIDGCPDYSRDTIKIYSEFVPQAMNDSYRLVYGEKGLLNILQNDILPEQNQFFILTQPRYGKVVINNKIAEYTPDLRFLQPVEFTYRVCSDFCDDLCHEAMVNIEFDDNITCKAPTIFTPNGDGINDQFVVPCLETGRFPANKLHVFNEWGVEVFFSSPYKNDWEGSFGGNSLPVGTYFYILDTGDGQRPVNGFLILQR